MPNWCETAYVCVGDKKEIFQLESLLQEMMEEEGEPNCFGNMWLGNLVNKLGEDWRKVSCRGEITDFETDSDSGDTLFIWQMTAWSEQEGVRESIEKKFPSIKVFFQEIECGNKLFNTNDIDGKYFECNYFLEIPREEWHYVNIEEVANHVTNIVGHKVEPKLESIEKELEDYVDSTDPEYGYCLMEIVRSNKF